MRKVVIVGGGVAGMGAAQRLVAAGCDVTLFESLPRLGGDCFGVDVQLPGRGVVRVDAGVSDFNQETFVRLKALLDELRLDYHPIVQDCCFMTPTGEALYHFRDGRLKADWPEAEVTRLRSEVERFNTECVEVLEGGDTFADWTLVHYLHERGYSTSFADLYVYPRAMGCFPMPDEDPALYPVRSLVAFWHMHGVVGRHDRAPRMCVTGGMHRYCAAMERWLEDRGGRILRATRVVGVVRRASGIEVRAITRDDEHLAFRADHVLFATNPNEVLPLLEDSTSDEVAAFSGFSYQRARLVVHLDARLMARDRQTWGAYNYVVSVGGGPEVKPTITFYPNLMGRLPERVPDVFVTMNPHLEPDPEVVVSNRFFEHPVANGKTTQAVARLERIQGERGTWFSGSYLQEPFLHEQALVSGQDIAERLLRADPHAGR
ncbi:MAG: NAD(P)-binding protein [Myxococcales bacterium]|nr:NAD(P)-binding protein [Myxococcales bacterium]